MSRVLAVLGAATSVQRSQSKHIKRCSTWRPNTLPSSFLSHGRMHKWKAIRANPRMNST